MLYSNYYGCGTATDNTWINHVRAVCAERKQFGKKCSLKFASRSYTKQSVHLDILKDERKQIEKKITDVDKKYKRLLKLYEESQIDNLHHDISNKFLNERNNDLRKTINNLRTKNQELLEENEDLEEHNENLQSYNDDLHTQAEDLDYENEHLRSYTHDLQSYNDDLELVNQSIQTELDRSNMVNNELQSDNNRLTNEINKYNQEISKYRDEIDKLYGDYEKLNDQIFEYETKANIFNHLYLDSVNRYNLLHAEYQKLLNKNIQTLSDLDKKINEFEDYTIDSTQQILFQDEKIQVLNNLIEEKQKILEMKDVAFKQLQNELNNKNDILNDLSKKYNDTVQKFADLNAKYNIDVQRISRQNFEIETIQFQLNELIKEKEKIELELALTLNELDKKAEKIVKDEKKIIDEYNDLLLELQDESNKVDVQLDVIQNGGVPREENYDFNEPPPVMSALKNLVRDDLSELDDIKERLEERFGLYSDKDKQLEQFEKLKRPKEKLRSGRKHSNNALINFFNTGKILSKAASKKMLKADLEYLLYGCLKIRKNYKGASKEMMRSAYNKCIKK